MPNFKTAYDMQFETLKIQRYQKLLHYCLKFDRLRLPICEKLKEMMKHGN